MDLIQLPSVCMWAGVLKILSYDLLGEILSQCDGLQLAHLSWLESRVLLRQKSSGLGGYISEIFLLLSWF